MLDAIFKAVHLPGGNFFNDMRVDLSKSFMCQDAWLENLPRYHFHRSAQRVHLEKMCIFSLKKLGLWESIITTGIVKAWLEQFVDYWCDCLNGRPLSVNDFLSLYFHYRCNFQQIYKSDWSSSEQHVQNWQRPENIFLTFQLVLRTALHPIRSFDFLSLLKPGSRVLEYGCGSAPMYNTWRRFKPYMPCSWTLCDIPGFPFHFVRHVCGADSAATFVTIYPDMFVNPLEGMPPFDIIILQEVMEHLDNPMQLIKQLTDLLKKGGLLFLDYVVSDATHLDTVAGLEQRMEVLKFLENKFEWVRGNFEVSGRSLPQVIGCKLY